MLLVCSHPGKRIGGQVLWARATVYMRGHTNDYLRISSISAADDITLFVRILQRLLYGRWERVRTRTVSPGVLRWNSSGQQLL